MTKPTTRKYEGIFQQGGTGAEDTFELMSELAYGRFIREYEMYTGVELKLAEKPSLEQLSAVRGRLIADKSPIPNFGLFGPHGDRLAEENSWGTSTSVDRPGRGDSGVPSPSFS